jgi:hypothetical protein
MYWFGNTPAVPNTFPLQNDWTFVSGDAFYYQPTFQNNAYARNEIYPSSFAGDGWINTYELYSGPMGYGGPGQSAGDARTGLIRSKPFSIQGNSISLLVGGGLFSRRVLCRARGRQQRRGSLQGDRQEQQRNEPALLGTCRS